MQGLKLNHVSKRGHWWNQAITWTNAEELSVKSSTINLWAISPEVPQPSIEKNGLNISSLNFNTDLPGFFLFLFFS